MVIPLFARVTGFKVESLWRPGARSSVRCTARLSRPLLTEEMERIGQLAEADVEGKEVVYECCSDEVEDRQLKLVETLAGASAVKASRAVGPKKARRPTRSGKQPRPRSPDPAA